MLVAGGPGTGKTTTALWAARSFLEADHDNIPNRVLFLTFSRSAVDQIQKRCPAALAGYEDRVEVSTFHAIAYRLIRTFGRYGGLGRELPAIQSRASEKLFQRDRSAYSYDDLLPTATALLEGSELVRRIVSNRWGLLICDEVQDTSSEQWQFLQLLSSNELLLLGDLGQMIYGWLPGVSVDTFHDMKEQVDVTLHLAASSFRDPSGAIPGLADAVRTRQFDHGAVHNALEEQRLIVVPDTGNDMVPGNLIKLVESARAPRHEDVGIFAADNETVAQIGVHLHDADIDHVLVGIPEAHGEALAAMVAQISFAVGLIGQETLRHAMALFVTACARGSSVPVLAHKLVGRMPLTQTEELALWRQERSLAAAGMGTVGGVAQAASECWSGLPIGSAVRPWQRAVRHFMRLMGRDRALSASGDIVSVLKQVVEVGRAESLVDLNYFERGRVMLMTLHQTKGREVDTVILVFRSEDYFGREGEPFEDSSRLLNVAISRARKRVIVVVPSDPHPLIAPFQTLAQGGSFKL